MLADRRIAAAAAENSNWSCPRERQATRDLILSAARTLAERDGTDAVSLSAVARETKIARAAIYSHFTSRQDLISALSEIDAVSSDEPVQQTVSVVDSAEATNVVPASVVAESVAGADEEPAQDDSYDKLMRAQAEALQQLTNQVIVPKPKQRDPAEATLTKLEARLSVTEQSFAALEQRVGERIKKLDEETGTLAETLQGLRTRLATFEKRQQAALAELRLELHNLQHPDVGSEISIPPELYPESFATVVTSEAEPVIETPVAVASPTESQSTRVPAYLDTARQAAINAATQAVGTPERKTKSQLIRVLFRKRWTVIAIAALLVAWFDFYVFAHYEPAQGGPAVTTRVATAGTIKRRTVLTPKAQLARGLKYLNGTGVPVDVNRAKRWLERAALGGEPVAQNLLGVLYQTGTGVPANMTTAIHWYELSATHGNLKAMTNLGKIYAGGWSEGTDFVKAAGWFTKAAAYGEVDAQFDLAVLYERGEGVSPSTAEAYKWYSIAARSGDRHAAERAAMLATQLATEQLQSADAAAVTFRPRATNRAANEVPAVKG